MLTFFINRAGKGLTSERRTSLNKAKELLSERVHAAHGQAKKTAQKKV